jgi:hypothetical protein
MFTQILNLNCFHYESKYEDWTRLFLFCPHLKWRTSWHVRKNSRPLIALSQSLVPACLLACGRLVPAELWCWGRRLRVKVGAGWQYSGNHRTACQPRLITLPHKRDGIFVRVRHVEMTIARNWLSGYGWNVSEEEQRSGNL